MANNFDSWRKAKMASLDKEPSHYHRVATATWLAVRAFLSTLLITRVEKQARRFSVTLSDDEANALLAFLDEMRFGYIHPRSTSARTDFSREAAYSSAIPLT